jgi:hypothetical protein
MSLMKFSTVALAVLGLQLSDQCSISADASEM